MLRYISKKIVLLGVLITCCNSVHAEFSDLFASVDRNYGVNIGFTIEKNASTVINNGDYYAMKKVSIHADMFKGTGFIDAPTIVIETKKFEFTGTIRCYGNCLIHAEEPFDETMFKREGSGSFIVTTGKNADNKQIISEGQISSTPLIHAVQDFPSHHPILLTGIVGLAVVAAYKVITNLPTQR